MIRFHLKELIARKEFEWNKKVTYEDITLATGIHRGTLSKIANKRGYNTTTDNIDALCAYFECAVGEFMERVSE